MARAGKSPCAFAPVAFLDTPDTADRDAVTHLARGDTRVAALPGAATAGVDAVAGLTWAHSRVAVLLGAATTGLHGVAGLARAHPKVAALLIASAKGGAADALAQRSGGGGGGGVDDIGGRQFDKQRNLAFVLYGGLYQGLALEYLFNHVFEAWFGSEGVLAKLVFNMFVLAPLLTLPAAYIVRSLVCGSGSLPARLRSAVVAYWAACTNEGLYTKFLLLWTPMNFIMFKSVPQEWRIPFNTIVSFAWTVFLSIVSSARGRR